MSTHRLRLASLAATTVTTLAIAAPAALPPGTLRVEQAQIIDSKGFEKPLVAATIMVPAGWRHQGSVDWQPGKPCSDGYAMRLDAQAPDGSAAIELTPPEGWGATNTGTAPSNCPAGNFATAQQYLQAWVQRNRPGAKWLDYRPRPERSRAGLQQAMPGGGFFKSWTETGQALIGYQKAGREMRESLAATVNFTQSQLNGPMGAMQTLIGNARGVLSWRAPAGQLDFRQFDAVWQTLRNGDEWQSRINAAQSQMAQENAATQARIGQIRAETSRETLAQIAKRGEIRRQTGEEIAQMRMETDRNRDATGERMQRDNVKTIRGIETYRDPRSGGVVELPNHYNHAWQLKDGSYVLTDNPAFDPARELGIGGEQMKVVR